MARLIRQRYRKHWLGGKRTYEYERFYVYVPRYLAVPDLVGVELRWRRFGHVLVLEPVKSLSTGEMQVVKTQQDGRARTHA